MHIRPILVAVTLTTVGIAGCMTDDASTLEGGVYDPDTQRYVQLLGDSLEISWAPGAFSSISNPTDADVDVTPPFGWIRLDGGPDAPGTFTLVGDTITTVPADSIAWFLPPPRDGPADFTVAGETITLDPAAQTDTAPKDQVVSGENVWALSAYQEAHFPHRQVSLPEEEGGNYWTSIDYFEQYFRDLGMDVEVDPYGTEDATMDATACAPETIDIPDITSANTRGFCPGSLANVVATLPGTDPDAPTIFVAGGHFDMVPSTTHAAFDDTSGTVATMELARAMSQFEWRHTLKFGLWGGEEDGILGSQFWIQTNPDAKATITSYWNLDVVGMSWPAPLPQPDPIVIAAGPDAPSDAEGGGTGPMADELIAFAQELQNGWFGYPAEQDGTDLWIYEGVASGQASGYAAVNAQSDHTPFMAAGIPAYFIFNGDALAGDNPIGIHNERDSLENMTRYAYYGGVETQAIMNDEMDGIPHVWDPADYAEAKQTLADSWEVIMWFPFYSTMLQDIGYWHAPGAAGQSEADS